MIAPYEAARPRLAGLGRPGGRLICLLGIDGSGKSTQAQQLVARLRQAGYPAQYVWGGRRAALTALPVLLGKARLGAPRRSAGPTAANGAAYGSYMRGARQLFRRRALRGTWRSVTVAEHVVQLWGRVALPLLLGAVVVCDRYLYDSLINQALLFGDGPAALAAGLRGAAAAALPAPDLGFWLDVPPAVALSRKHDVYALAQLEGRAPLYRAAADALGFQRLDGQLAPGALGDALWAAVLRHLSARAPLGLPGSGAGLLAPPKEERA